MACVYILVGRRLGLDVGGCNWPSHFLARTRVGDTLMLVDCFNGGVCTDADAFLKMQGPSGEAARTIVYADTDTKTMVARVLRNLVNAYQRLEWSDELNVMAALLEDLERRR